MAPAVHINSFAQKASVRQMAPNHRLSFPEGKSVNDSIYQNSVAMDITVKSSQRVAITLCTGSLIAKIDIKAAYRLIPMARDKLGRRLMQCSNGKHANPAQKEN